MTRLKNLMKRAANGESLVIGFLGGSITQGSLSSTPKTCYASMSGGKNHFQTRHFPL